MKSIIKKTLITEKNTIHNAAGVYVFEVAMDADKPVVKKAVESLFKVKVVSVNTTIGRGRTKATKFGRSKAAYFKKAFVRLAPGEKIALFEGV